MIIISNISYSYNKDRTIFDFSINFAEYKPNKNYNAEFIFFFFFLKINDFVHFFFEMFSRRRFCAAAVI